VLLGIPQSDELDHLLLTVSDVLSTNDTASGIFEQRTLDWLLVVRTALQNNRMPLASKVDVVRAELTIALRPPRREQRPTRRDRAVACVHALETTVEELRSELRTTHARIEEADALSRRLIAIAKHKRITDEFDLNRPEAVSQLINAMRLDSDVSAGVVQLDSLVGPRDGVIVVARRLSDFY
jgi:hypothetical protein